MMRTVKGSEVAAPKFIKQLWNRPKIKEELCVDMKNKVMISIIISSILFFSQCRQENIQHAGSVQTSNNLVETKESIQNFNAKVIRIVDGDTLEVLYEQLPIMIRLEHIDCPEKRGKQPYGKEAKQTLSDLCFEQEIVVEWNGDKDRNGRYICILYTLDGLNINQEMIRKGMAWHFKKYSSDEIYSQLENEARQGKVGLWKDPNPIAPWEWRK